MAAIGTHNGADTPRGGIAAHRVRFTGSGGEYFRVWIVNVLLSIVTLGLYTPWARRRTAQYFYSHTLVAGSPLEFTAQQRRMVFGFLAMAALYLAFKLAQQTGQDLAASLLFFGFALLLPWLWGSAMRFRLGATRWRGVRLAFVAPWREVYLASWPVFAIAALWTALFFLASAMAPAMPLGTAETPRVRPLPDFNQPALWALLGLGLVLTLLCVIRLEYNYRRLLVARTRIGGHTGHWKPRYRDFVRVWLATAGFFVLCLLAMAAVVTVATGAAMPLYAPALRQLGGQGLGALVLAVLLAVLAAVLLMVAVSVPARAFREARMFQLVWNNVGLGPVARTRTSLRTPAFVWLRTRNLLLTLLTLGFFRPFAVTSEYAAKVGSVTLYLKGGTDQLVGELVQQQGAFGDAAADALGLDIIG